MEGEGLEIPHFDIIIREDIWNDKKVNWQFYYFNLED